MRKTLSCLCAAALVLCSVYPAHAATQTTTAYTTMSNFSHVTADGIYHYSTSEKDSDNYIAVDIEGNTLRIKRRANQVYTHPDRITIRTNGVTAVEKQMEWTNIVGDNKKGYDAAIDISALQYANHTLEIKSRKESYTYIVLNLSFQKDISGSHFSKDQSLSRQYNYDALRRLDAGEAPDDFTCLQTMYGKNESDKQILREIEEKTKSVIAGCGSNQERILAISRWIAQNIAYDVDASGDDFHSWLESNPGDEARLDSPLLAFKQGYALCYGFARLTTLMMGYAGIDCVYMTGRLENNPTGNINNEGITDPDKLNHAWNVVKLDGSWYFLDNSLDALKNYYRTDKANASTGYTAADRASDYLHQFASLSYMSQRHIGLRLGVKNYGVKLKATPIPDGWQKESGVSVYYTDGVKLRSSWAQIDGSIYYFDEVGAVSKGWRQVENYWRYFDENGALLTGVQTIKDADEERSYTFDNEGCLTADNAWVIFGGAKRYYSGREIAQGWKYVEGCWRYFDSSGVMYDNPEKTLAITDGEYSFNDQGALYIEGSGWLTFNGEKHYFEGERALTGPQQIDGASYLFDGTGVMQTGWQYYEGKTYFLGTDGVMLTGWQFLDNNWYYLDADQGMYIGAHSVGGGYHYFDSQGRLSTGGWVDVDGSKLYFEKSKQKNGVAVGGTMMKGWRKVDEKLRFFDRTDGRMYTGSEPMLNENNGKWYTFSQDGIATMRQ